MQSIVQPLLEWYDHAKRTLPWRGVSDPYSVWVSEIMLQQTRVAAVVSYYTRWMQALPTVEALAAVDEKTLYKLWEGLGYYSRARNLQKAAVIVVRDYAGVLPRSVEELRRLPGIGDYTAGAIASIAYGIPVPAVDGNVLRVLSRLQSDYTDILEPSAKTRAFDTLSPIIPPDRAADFTQAMFELGALVCLPKSPRCDECPLGDRCNAYRDGLTTELPVRVVKTKRKTKDMTVLVLSTAQGYVLTAPKEKGLLAGTYGLPLVETALDESDVAAACTEWGVYALNIQHLPKAKHVFTHITWNMVGYLVECAVEELPAGTIVAGAEDIRARYAIPTAFGAYKPYLQ